MCVEKKDLTGICQVTWKRIISLASHILVTSVARRPGQGTVSDSTMEGRKRMQQKEMLPETGTFFIIEKENDIVSD